MTKSYIVVKDISGFKVIDQISGKVHSRNLPLMTAKRTALDLNRMFTKVEKQDAEADAVQALLTRFFE